jgi:tetratricopeptide (TPR) repeat protein
MQGGLIRERFGQLMIISVFARALLAVSLAEIGRFDEAIVFAAEGVEVAQAPEHPVSVMYSLWSLGRAYLGKGHLSKAMPVLDRVLWICRDLQLPLFLHVVTPTVGAAYILDGRSSAAVELMESALQNDEETKLRPWHAMTLAVLSEAVLANEDTGRAAHLAERALEVARRHHQRGYEARVQWLLGEISSRQPSCAFNEVNRHYSDALALANECGMRPLIAHCHLGVGKLYGSIGKREKASEHIATAANMYREMDMQFWLPLAETEMRPPGWA